MSNIYNPIIYSLFLKEIRKKNNLTTQDLALKSYFSVGTINNLENSTHVLHNPNTIDILKVYQLPKDYLVNCNASVIDEFINSLLFLKQDIKERYKKVMNYYMPYKNTILYFIAEVCEFMYDVYTSNYSKNLNIDFLEQKKYLLSEQYLALCNIYLGQFYVDFKKYNLALQSYDAAKLGIEKHTSNNAMLHYCLAAFYVQTKDVIKSIQHCDLAIKYFAETHNVRRLMNTNIIKGLQYLEIRDFKKALNINKESLDKNPPDLEKRIFLNNMAYIYLIQEKFEEALKCFEDMPQEQMLDKHYLGYMFTLYELAQYNRASSVCQTGLAISNKDYYTEIFQAFQEYFNTCDLNLLGKKMSKIVKKYQDILNDNELEEYYGILYRMFKKSGHYKKSLEYLEKIHQLSLN